MSLSTNPQTLNVIYELCYERGRDRIIFTRVPLTFFLIWVPYCRTIWCKPQDVSLVEVASGTTKVDTAHGGGTFDSTMCDEFIWSRVSI